MWVSISRSINAASGDELGISGTRARIPFVVFGTPACSGTSYFVLAAVPGTRSWSSSPYSGNRHLSAPHAPPVRRTRRACYVSVDVRAAVPTRGELRTFRDAHALRYAESVSPGRRAQRYAVLRDLGTSRRAHAR
ncbi:hypothetical protein [Kribbella jejuensis]|uniref:hypothetical protein n=1 Tax=Kribbella jejuensis TaxID=236068 RepID=UPI00115393A5|nr:hypothetical protein [Kribbella jejuensis]